MELWLYQTSKVTNSTYQPVEVISKITDFYIIHSADMISPTIKLNGWTFSNSQDETFMSANYCWISVLNRYYFISSIGYDEDGFVLLNCEVDTLATYKNDILKSYQYVERSASQFDGSIIDTLYSTKSNPTKVTQAIDSPFHLMSDFMSCFYVCGLIDNNGKGANAISYYAMPVASVRAMNQVLQSNYLEEYNENPIQFIKKLIYIPMRMTSLKTLFNTDDVGVIQSFTDPIVIRSGTTIGAGRELMTYVNKFRFDVNLQNHPQARDRGIYLNQEPFREIYLNIPPFGVIKLPTSNMMTTTTIRIWVYLDLTSGAGTLEVYDTVSGILIHRQNAQIGIEVPLEQVVTNRIGEAQNIMSGIGSLLTGNIGGVMSSIGNAVNLKYPKSSSVGGMGNFNDIEGDDSINYIFNELVDEDNANKGRPLCKKIKLDTLSGFTVVSNAKIEINGTSQEKNQLSNLMEEGFYIE